MALALVHAVNPYGFSHLCRGNEGNVDLNRNFRCFPDELPDEGINADYSVLHPLLVPAYWPPSADVESRLAALRDQWGPIRFRRALMAGQSHEPTGLFYSGRSQQWSNTVLRQVLRRAGGGKTRIAWIDVHSGLGASGAVEKIYSGRPDPQEFARARAAWGADVLDPFDPQTVASPASGTAGTCIYDECPSAQITSVALEFGTVPMQKMLSALRGSQWLLAHPQTSKARRTEIELEVRGAFNIDSEAWRGMVFAQVRATVVQAALAFDQNRTPLPTP